MVVKVSDAAAGADEVFHLRFRRETGIAAQLAYPHPVPIFECGGAQGMNSLARPYVPGGSLRGRMRDPWTVAEVVGLLSPLAGALERYINHGGLQPNTVLFDGDGRPLLSVFASGRGGAAAGLAKDPAGRYASAGELLATLAE